MKSNKKGQHIATLFTTCNSNKTGIAIPKSPLFTNIENKLFIKNLEIKKYMEEQFYSSVKKMRDAQRSYFRTRSKSHLNEALRWEREVDFLIHCEETKNIPEQQSLFKDQSEISEKVIIYLESIGFQKTGKFFNRKDNLWEKENVTVEVKEGVSRFYSNGGVLLGRYMNLDQVKDFCTTYKLDKASYGK